MLEIVDRVFARKKLVNPVRLERTTYCLEGNCSIQLSYGSARAQFLLSSGFAGNK
jgi:hypothetical protein